jgi:lipid II:glycine glycyltransferase (peptidoglycan interpeptide bridge formation enzyme)
LAALTGSGAGELFQVTAGGRILSSILVLLAARGGYYHSAGTRPEGMSCGASHFLVSEIAAALQAAGLTRFNLGGVSGTGTGLEQFKHGFGTTRVELQAVECELTGAFTAVLTAGARAGMRMWRKIATVSS